MSKQIAQLQQLIRQNINLDKKELSLMKKPKKKRQPKKSVSNTGGLLHESIKGALHAFSTITPISALTNAAPTLKLQSRSKMSMTGGSNVASLLLISPNIFDSYTTYSGSPTRLIADGTNGFTLTTARQYPDAVFYNISSSALNLGNTTNTPSVLYAPAYSSLTSAINEEQEGRIVSVGIRLQNRTVLQYRMPIAYVYHDFHGQLANKILGDNQITHSELETWITSNPHTITWDCTKEPILEFTITRDNQDGIFTQIFDNDPDSGPPGYLKSANQRSDLVFPVGNWGSLSAGKYLMTNAPLVSNPSVFILFPGPASTAFINQYELTMINHYEVKNHVLEASGMLTPSLSAKGVAEVVNSVKHHKHRNIGKMLSTAVKPLCMKAMKEASGQIADTASKVAVSAAIAAL